MFQSFRFIWKASGTISAVALATGIAWAHPFHMGFPFAQKHDPSLLDYPTSVKFKEDGFVEYSFVISERDILRNLKIDQNRDLHLSDEEFDEGYVAVDKWVREHVSLSSERPWFVGGFLGRRGSCELKMAEYGLFALMKMERVFNAILTFQCPTIRGLRIRNSFMKVFYRKDAQLVLMNIIVQKTEEKSVWLRYIELDEEVDLQTEMDKHERLLAN